MDTAGTGRTRTRSDSLKRERSFWRGLTEIFQRTDRGRVDIPFVIIVSALVVIGLVMLLSASYPYALYYRENSYEFFASQLIFAVAGAGVAYLVSRFDYHHWHRVAVILLIVSYILLVVVLFMGGTKRWFRIGPISFQPSEVAKFALIVFLSDYISRHFKQMHTFTIGFLPPILVLGMMAGLLMMEPHLSCTVIISVLTISILFIGGINWRYLAIGAAILIAGLIFLVLFTDVIGYAQKRLAYWFDPFSDMLGDGWQTVQSLFAIGSGGVFGQGLGNSRQKHLYLPEPQNDFIFAIVCEELGFIGALVVVLLFAALVWRGFVIAMRAKDRFGKMLGIGLTIQVGLQALLNIGVVTGALPNTGISLPFFSYGGTSLMMLLMQMGVILSISRTAHIEKT